RPFRFVAYVLSAKLVPSVALPNADVSPAPATFVQLIVPCQVETSSPFARAVTAAGALAGTSAISTQAQAVSTQSCSRRARMRAPTTRMRLAWLCSSEVNEALLRDRRGGFERLPEPRPPHELSGAGRGDEPAVLDEHCSAQEHVLRCADDLGDLVGFVVTLRVGCGG